MISNVMQTSSTASGAAAGSTSTSSASSATPPVTENMFLQLLVTQLKNQDPSNPADSTQFVTQLAQFQTMEQSMNQGENITAIRNDLDQLVTAMSTSSSNNSNSTTATK
jgi:flagellar basal-body rod modification protein FlgD